MTVPTQREASLPSGAPHRSSSSSEHTKAPGSGRSASPIAPPRAAVAPAAAACSASGGDTCAPTRAAAHCLPVSTLCHSFRAGPSPIQAQAVGPVARPPLFKSVPCHPPARICTHPARGAVSTPCPQNRDEAGVGASSPPLTPCVRLPCMALGPSGRPAPREATSSCRSSTWRGPNTFGRQCPSRRAKHTAPTFVRIRNTTGLSVRISARKRPLKEDPRLQALLSPVPWGSAHTCCD